MNQQPLQTPNQPSMPQEKSIPTPLQTDPTQSPQISTPPPQQPQNVVPMAASPATAYQPTIMPEEKGGKRIWVLVIILLILLIIGGLFLASWEGWISLGGLEKYWKKAETTSNVTPPDNQISSAAAHDKTRKADLVSIKDALKAYFQAKQSYPLTTSLQKTSDPDGALSVLVPTYLAKLPNDPLAPNYYYGYTSDGKTFELTARLEDTTDPSAIKASASIYLYKVTDSSVETPTSTTTE